MKRKLRSWQILKIKSSTIHASGYDLDMPLDKARRTGSVVKVGESALVSAIRAVTGRDAGFDKIDALELEIRSLSKKRNSDKTREKMSVARNELDRETFVDELVAVVFSDDRHYKRALKDGVFINGKEYVRILAGAGNIRRNTVFFIERGISDEVRDILDNGRDKSAELNPAKFGAYFGLYASAGIPVSFPRVATIDDLLVKRSAEIQWVDDGGNVSQVEKDVELNCFDGQGLISPEMAAIWAEDLGLDYIPSTFIIRAPFAKGQVVVFDFKRLSEELGVQKATDVWGDDFYICDTDIVLSKSQMKLWDSYASQQQYQYECKKNGLGFRVSRYSPKRLKADTTTNYMFLQALGDIDEDGIADIVYPTLDFFEKVVTRPDISPLYLSGKDAFLGDFSSQDYWRLDFLSRLILLFPKVIGEKWVQDRIRNTLKKKMKQAKLGKLIVEGNYSPLVSDPYAQAEHLCGLDARGLLSTGENYSKFWSDMGIKRVASARSPLTHSSELLESKIISRASADLWYGYLDTVFILPYDTLDTLLYADSDFDGDLVFTANSETLLKWRRGGSPISYKHGKARKEALSDALVSSADMHGMNSKIGFITNTSSSYHCMRFDPSKSKSELGEIERRLVLLRVFQGEEIDGAKNGGVKRKMPLSWVRYHKGMSDSDISLIADKRPAFTRFLYDGYMKRYKDEIDNYNKYSWSNFGKCFSDILGCSSCDADEMALVERYKKYSFFMFHPSPMNRISDYVVSALSQIGFDGKKVIDKNFSYSEILSRTGVEPNDEDMRKMHFLYEKYRSAKRAWGETKDSWFKKDIYLILSGIRRDAEISISQNSEDLGNLAAYLMMDDARTRSFCWSVFGEDILENIMSRHGRQISVPIRDDFGDIEFMFDRYSMTRIFIDDKKNSCR